LRFDPERQIGTPMIEKPRYPARKIDRDVLMSRACWESLFQQIGRGNGSGRDENFERGPRLEQPLDQRQHCRCLSDTCGMNPNERSARPDLAWNSPTLLRAQGVLPAAPAPPLQVDDHERRKRPGQPA